MTAQKNIKNDDIDASALPLISVIIPIYKVAQYLNDCVTSIINQTYKNFQIILVDDGSPDSCPSMCDDFAERDSRIQVIHQKNSGLSHARNAGIKAAIGEFLIFVDSDDLLAQSDALQNIATFLCKNSANVTYCSNVLRIKKDGACKYARTISNELLFLSPAQLFDLAIKYRFFFAAWTFVVRRQFLIDHSLFFFKGLIYEDMEWIPRLFTAEPDLKIYIFSKPFYIYRYNTFSITHTVTQYHFDCMQTIVESLRNKIVNVPQDTFIKGWLNINLNALFGLCYPDRAPNKSFYQKNIITVKHFYKINYKFLTPRNKLLFVFLMTSPRLFFVIRKVRNLVKGL